MRVPTKEYIDIQGAQVPYWRIDNDVMGNPRYVVHFLDLGIKPEDYGKIPGLDKYHAKWFGGGYVIQSYNLESDLMYYKNFVERHYKNK